jgi:CHRD domain-containing protein
VRKLVSILLAGALAMLVFTAVSSARPKTGMLHLSATLNAGQEIPKQAVKDATAHGTFTATLSGTHLSWTLTFAKLTGPATAAHIHLGGMGKAGNVVVALCGPCKSSMKGTGTITASLLKTIKKHGTYVNVHTAKNPAGEIRGQLVAKG